MKSKKKNFRQWNNLVKKIKEAKDLVKIGIVGKYFGTGDFTLTDSYISVIEAIKHAAWSQNQKPEITWLDAEAYEKRPEKLEELKNFDGIIVPGGFGKRGVEGKIMAINYVRENNIPFLGLCYGLQLAVVEFARNICGLKNAHTTEVNPETEHPVICTMADQVKKIEEKNLGGSMRLGTYECQLAKNSLCAKLYGTQTISERHRHRYEVNNKYRKNLEQKGLALVGHNPKHDLVEMIELSVQPVQGKPGHKFFIGSQFHPELKSRPLNPHPLFVGLVKAAIIKQ